MSPSKKESVRTEPIDPRAADPGSSLWARVRDNANENRPFFQESGIHEHGIAVARCDDCGARESAHFWTPTRRTRRALHLECPYCTRGTARYGIRDHRVRTGLPFGTGHIVTAITLLVAALIASAGIFQGDEIMRIVDRTWPRVTGQSAEFLPWNRPDR